MLTPWLVAAHGAGPDGMFRSPQFDRARKCEPLRTKNPERNSGPTRVKLLEHNAGTEYRTRKNQWCVLLHSTEAKPSDARRTSCDIYLTKRAATAAVAVLRTLPKTLPLPAVDSLARAEAIMNLPDMTDAQMQDISKDYQDHLADDDEWDPDAPETGTDVLIGRSFDGVTVPTSPQTWSWARWSARFGCWQVTCPIAWWCVA